MSKMSAGEMEDAVCQMKGRKKRGGEKSRDEQEERGALSRISRAQKSLIWVVKFALTCSPCKKS